MNSIEFFASISNWSYSAQYNFGESFLVAGKPLSFLRTYLIDRAAVYSAPWWFLISASLYISGRISPFGGWALD
jgi:hypothetical protein